MRGDPQLRKLATMPRADKFWLSPPAPNRTFKKKTAAACIWLSLFFACGFLGCDRLTSSRYTQLMQDADAKSEQGDFERAINLYEAALDDSPRCAEIHYKLAVLYDDKLNDPVSALHHFRRCLVLSPNGSHAKDAQNSIKRDEVAVLTTLSGDSVITRSEVARLRNENLNLRKEPEARTASSRIVSEKSAVTGGSSKKIASKNGDRTYVVRSGDTLFSISRKFYKSPKHWKEILDANEKNIRNPKKLTVGQTLIIP